MGVERGRAGFAAGSVRGEVERHGPRRPGLAIPVLCAGAFAVLSVLVSTGSPVVRADRDLFGWTHAHRIGWLYHLAIGATYLGSPSLLPVALLAVAIGLALRGRGRRPLLTAGVAVALLAAGVLAAKAGLARVGPQPVTAPGSWLAGLLSDGSVDGGDRGAFPSGHTTTAVVGWTVGLWLLFGGRVPARGRVVLLAAVGAVSAGLVYAGFHWLSDVLAGWAFGGLIAWTAIRIGAHGRGRSPVTVQDSPAEAVERVAS